MRRIGVAMLMLLVMSGWVLALRHDMKEENPHFYCIGKIDAITFGCN